MEEFREIAQNQLLPALIGWGKARNVTFVRRYIVLLRDILLIIVNWLPVPTVCLLFAASGSWSLVNTTGAVVKGGYGHSSVYDELTGMILVHGGYHSMSAATYLLTDALYEFNPNTSAWYACCSCSYID